MGYGGSPSDVHGVVVTYQQVAMAPAAFRPMVRQSLVILDEIHHAGDSRSWGDGIRQAFDPAWRRLCLSGTPFRSDQMTIPFVTYVGELAQPDFEYGFGDALTDGQVVRPVYFPRNNGRMEWTAPDGVGYEATFDDRLARELAEPACLRTALDVSGEWMPTGCSRGRTRSRLHLRTVDPTAAGLAIAIDQEHAKGIAAIMEERLGVLAHRGDVGRSGRLRQDQPVRGRHRALDRRGPHDLGGGRHPAPAGGRLRDQHRHRSLLPAGGGPAGALERTAPPRRAAYMFIPDDVRLRTFGAAIAEQRRHSLRKERGVDDREDSTPPVKRTETERDLSEQLSLFAPISAVPLDEQGRPLDEASVHEPQNDILVDAEADGDRDEEIPDHFEAGAIADLRPWCRCPRPSPRPPRCRPGTTRSRGDASSASSTARRCATWPTPRGRATRSSTRS